MTVTVPRTWLLWLAGVIALAGLAFSAAGYAMAASFAAAAPERRAPRQASVAYLALGAVSAASLGVVSLALARHARRRSRPDSPAV